MVLLLICLSIEGNRLVCLDTLSRSVIYDASVSPDNDKTNSGGATLIEPVMNDQTISVTECSCIKFIIVLLCVYHKLNFNWFNHVSLLQL